MENFEELLQKELDKLPYTKHLDDGQYNDGQIVGFEIGARWALSLFNTIEQNEQLCSCSSKILSNGNIQFSLCRNCQNSMFFNSINNK
jgi:hypothetical protein